MAEKPRPSRVERRRQETREEILEAARELLLEVGLEELTLRQVARRADFSPAALYTYFSSRDEVVAALVAESFRRLDGYLRRVPDDLPPARRVIELGVAYMDFARDNPVDLQCILNSRPQSLPPGSEVSIGLEAARLIGQTFREGFEQGVFVASEGESAAEMAYGVWALVHGMAAIRSLDLSEVVDDVAAAPRRVLEAYVGRLTATGGGADHAR
jgi:AcrR family transcriptional regulator